MESADGAGGVTRSFERDCDAVGVGDAGFGRACDRGRAARRARDASDLHLRFSDDITTRHRFRDGDRIFRIVSLRDRDGRKRFLEIEAEESVD